MDIDRRSFIAGALATGILARRSSAGAVAGRVSIATPREGEDVFAWLQRVHGRFDRTAYCQVLGAANPYKEGDEAHGLAAADDASREHARTLLSRTTVGALLAHPIFDDEVSAYADAIVDAAVRRGIEPWTMGRLARFLLDAPEPAVRAVMPGLASDVIACTVKLLSNAELVAVGQKIFNPLPGSRIGARGYMGARIQPNSPTDDPEDILMQVLDGWAYAVGDLVLGTNPVSSDVAQVAAVQHALKDVLVAFGLESVLPHCVLAHIDVQAAVEEMAPGTTALWFQSLAGVADANTVFDIDVAKMVRHARARRGPFGLYFETGQGADGTNGHAKGFDMVIHESRKYGFARALAGEVARVRRDAGRPGDPWVHVNDVAGFIGPEVFRTREQLVRVCLEDTVMGKLHGLTIGLDICSTLHMDVTLDDLDWCIEQVMPANPAYLMALPTKNDPMLSYLTTAFQDHVRVRERFGYRVDDRMWAFFQRLGVIDAEGRPTTRFGDPRWVYLQYRRAKQDERSDEAILDEASERMARVRARGVFLAEGHGERSSDMLPVLDAQVRALYADAKLCIRAELPADFARRFAAPLALRTQSADRDDYILHPVTGEGLDEPSSRAVDRLRLLQAGQYDVQVVVSDGLNALALTDEGHLAPYLDELRRQLQLFRFRLAPETLVVTHGRVRAGYRIGERLFGDVTPGTLATIVHIIGERPGNGHHTYSAYVTQLDAHVWTQPGVADHNHTRVISNIADTALDPVTAAQQSVALLVHPVGSSGPAGRPLDVDGHDSPVAEPAELCMIRTHHDITQEAGG
jgi:ethanolamine ammonia-lyase large subunit